MLNVGYFGGCGRPVLFTHYVAIGAQIVEQPIEGIIIFADVDLQPKETEIDFWRNPLLPETKRRARRARSAWSVAVDHVTPIEDERTEASQAGPAQKGFEKEAPAARPAFPAQAEERLVSIPQRLAHARSTRARSGARAK